jgi:hypothetical protein
MAKTKVGGGPGEKAGHIHRRFLPDTEVIGPPECPILHRWTLLELGRKVTEGSGPSRRFKVLLHHFQPNADDRAEHDHPRSFVTIVLWGSYVDTSNDGTKVERMHFGKVRFRPATHRHVTKVGPHGCWTLVIMGPIRRRWGFWADGRWYFWRDHEKLFGFGMRCPEEAEDGR